MSSRREVLIRILALLQRKTLLETKYRTLKCLKRHYSTVQSIKMLQCWRRTGHLPSFFVPTRGIWQLKSPHPREFTIEGKKKNVNARESAWGEGGGGWAQLELTDALRPPEHLAKEISRLIVLSRLTRPTGLWGQTRQPRSRPLVNCSRVLLKYAKIRTVLQSKVTLDAWWWSKKKLPAISLFNQ